MRRLMLVLMAAIVALSFAPVTNAATKDATSKDAAKPAAKEKDPFGSMTVQQVAKKIKDPAVHVYDGNNEDLYKENHVPGAVRLYSKNIKEGVLPEKKDTMLIFYCHNEL